MFVFGDLPKSYGIPRNKRDHRTTHQSIAKVPIVRGERFLCFENALPEGEATGLGRVMSRHGRKNRGCRQRRPSPEWNLILKEAGGFVDFFEEDKSTPLKKNILATNTNIHDQLRELIRKKDIE